MEDPIAMAELESSERHSEPTLDIGGQEDDRAVLDDELEVCIEELQHEIEVRL